MKKVNLVVSVVLGGLLMLPLAGWAQWCPNLNFSSGTFANWQCYTGSWAGSNSTIDTCSPISGQHTIMNAQVLHYTGKFYDEIFPSIPKVPDGYDYSCKIGNSGIGAKIDGIEYEMTVDSMNSLLMLSFAWVMENSPHAINNNPLFVLVIKDSMNHVLNIPCSNMLFIAGDWQDSVIYDGSMAALPWTTVGYSLEAFMSQKIKIYFETRDCTEDAHFGYAYVAAECRPVQIELAYCEGSCAARLKAPDGFASYTWTRSSDTIWKAYTQQIALPNSQDGEIFTCTLLSKIGCESEVKYVIERTTVNVDFMFGVKEANGGVDFPANNNQNWYDTCNHRATFVDMSKVINSKKDKILWEIVGTKVSSGDSMFTYTFPEAAIPTTCQVRLTVFAENGCADTSSRYITIYPAFIVDSVYAQFTTPQKYYCNNTNVSFTNQSNADVSQLFPNFNCSPDVNLVCEWDWGDGSPIESQNFINGEAATIEHRYNFLNKETKVVVTLVTRVKGDNSHRNDTYTDTLTIIRPTIADFTSSNHYFPCIGTIGKEIFFTDASVSIAHITNYTWTFGDKHCPPSENRAEGENMTNPSHLYSKAGIYDVMLIVEDEIGCVDTMLKPKWVNIDGPVGTFTYSPLSGCVPLSPVTFVPNIEIGMYGLPTADTVIWFPDGITPYAVGGYAVNNTYRHRFDIEGYYLPLMQMIKWVDNNGTKERCEVTVEGIDTIWVIDCTGIQEALQDTKLRVYPNPANNQLTIEYGSSACFGYAQQPTLTAQERPLSEVEVEIYSVVGQRVLAPLTPLRGEISPFEGGRGMSEITIDISHLPAGMYFLKVGNKTARFVKE